MLDIDLLLESEGLYRSVFPDGVQVTFRLLTLKEYRVFRGLREGGIASPHQIASMVFSRCNLGGELSLYTRAGIEVSIGQLILYLSGDGETELLKEEIQQARAAYPATSVVEHMKRVICLAFPYKPEELDLLTRKNLISKFVVAEEMLVARGLEYQKLDLKQIKTGEEVARRGAVDFAQDNASLSKAIPNAAEEDNGRIGVANDKLKKKLARRNR